MDLRNVEQRCALSTWKFICSHATACTVHAFMIYRSVNIRLDVSDQICNCKRLMAWAMLPWRLLHHISYSGQMHINTRIAHTHVPPETRMHRYDVVERRIEFHWTKLKMDEMKYFDWCSERDIKRNFQIIINIVMVWHGLDTISIRSVASPFNTLDRP